MNIFKQILVKYWQTVTLDLQYILTIWNLYSKNSIKSLVSKLQMICHTYMRTHILETVSIRQLMKNLEEGTEKRVSESSAYNVVIW